MLLLLEDMTTCRSAGDDLITIPHARLESHRKPIGFTCIKLEYYRIIRNELVIFVELNNPLLSIVALFLAAFHVIIVVLVRCIKLQTKPTNNNEFGLGYSYSIIVSANI